MSIIIGNDVVVQGFEEDAASLPLPTDAETKFSTSTGKFPAPLQDNPPQHPSRLEAARAFALKCAQFPKA
jgi:hypothetical protein